MHRSTDSFLRSLLSLSSPLSLSRSLSRRRRRLKDTGDKGRKQRRRQSVGGSFGGPISLTAPVFRSFGIPKSALVAGKDVRSKARPVRRSKKLPLLNHYGGGGCNNYMARLRARASVSKSMWAGVRTHLSIVNPMG